MSDDVMERESVTQGASFLHELNVEEVPCGEFGCPGCGSDHWRHTGPETVEFVTEGQRFTAELVPGTARWEAVR